MQRDPSRAVATCQTLAFVDDADIDGETFVFRFAPTGGPRILTAVENIFGDTCALFRADALRSVGGFETVRWSPHEDWETLTKLAFAGFDVDVVPRPLFWYRTEVGGRLEVLTADPGRTFRLRRRMIEQLLADVELDHWERIALWDCLLGSAQPSEEAVRLQAANDEVSRWAHEALADANAWRERQLAETSAWRDAQLEELRAFLLSQLDLATARADRAERRLAKSVAGVDGGRPIVPVRELWLEALQRTARDGMRRLRRQAQASGWRR